MQNFTPLPTANPEWGFWGTSIRSNYDAAMTWDITSRLIAETFKTTPEHTRDLLDARFGRHLADELSFITGGQLNPETITDHINGILKDRSWRRYFEKAIHETKQV